MTNIKRYYRKEYPDIEDIVVVKITGNDEYGYSGDLIEYQNIKGFLLLSEIFKGRHVQKNIFKIGDIIAALVLNYNEKDKLAELSKKKLKNDEIEEAMNNHKIRNNINKIINEIYVLHNNFYGGQNSIEIEQIMDAIWDHYENEDEAPEKIYDNILSEPQLVLSNTLFEMDFIDSTLINIKNRTIKNDVVLAIRINLVMMEDNAVEKIKTLLCYDSTMFANMKGYNVKIQVSSSPLYKITCSGPSYDQCVQILKSITQRIKDNAKQMNCYISFDEMETIVKQHCEYKFMTRYELNLIKQ